MAGLALGTAAAVGIVAATIVAFAWMVWRLAGDRPDGTDDTDDRGGGGNVRRDPPGPGGSGGPAWWPAFEREFADYVAWTGAPACNPTRDPSELCARAA